MDYRKTASEILSAIGGRDNLVSAAHCATRLRLVIADNSKADKSALDSIDGVKGVFESAGQLQIIIGTGIVNKVYSEFIDLSGAEAATKDDVKQAAAAKSNWFKRAIKIIGDIFIPIIPAIVATGLLNGLLGGLSKLFPALSESHIFGLLDIFSNTALTFLPILIAISAAKAFKGNIFLGAVIGMIMIHPNLVNAWSVGSGAGTETLFSWFGLWNIQNTGYQGHVIPVIIAVFIMCKLENWLHKKVPEVLDLFVTPLVSVVVAGFLTMTFIGPVFAQIETWVLSGAQWLISIPFGIGAFIMGGVYAPTVVAGVHHMYNAIEMMMIADNGMNTWMPIATAANVAQGAAALAVALKTKNRKIRSLALPASLSAFMGITEPAIFGVNVRYMRPFVAGMIGGACSAVVGSLTGVYATANGVTGLFGFLITTDCFVGYLFTFLTAAAAAFIASWLMGIKEDIPAAVSSDAELGKASTPPAAEFTTETAADENTVSAPVAGRVVALKDVPDETFAAGILGQGAAVEPSEGRIIAPTDGKISSLLDTRHAVGLTLDNGIELLVHVGINTVELNGKGFAAHVAEGDRIKRGQPLITFDIDFIREMGYNTITTVIVTNADDFKAVTPVAAGEVKPLDSFISVERG